MDKKAAALLVLCNLLGGASYALTAAALEGFTPYWLVLLRTALAVPLFLPFMRFDLAAADWARVAAVGLLGYALPLYLGTLGQDYSTSTKAALLVGVEPVCVVLLSWVFLGERLRGHTAAAMASSLLGAALIVGKGAAAGLERRGDLILALHGFCWALYTVIGKPALTRVEPLTFTALTNLVAALGLAALLPWTGFTPPAGRGAWAAALFLTIGVTFGATALWNVALKRVPASAVAPFIFLQPVFGAFLGAVMGEPLTAWTAAGGALVLLGVVLTSR